MGEYLGPLSLYFLAVLILAAGMLGISALLGERHRERATDEPYESGIAVTGSAQLRVPIQFYLMAMLFVIFDMEAAFIFAWAVAVPEVGWLGFGEMLVFIGILLVALIYLWRVGALEWGTPSQSVLVTRKERQDALVAH
ncbi:MAG: NADH-quinone oxidoreductase subunit A [Nitrospiraceae bacterium]